MKKLPLAASIAILRILSPLTASASPPGQVAPGSTAERSDAAGGPRGVELWARPGYGSAGAQSPVRYHAAPLAYHPDPGQIYDGTASPYGSGFAGQLGIGYRPLPYFSLGAYAEARSSSTSAPDDGTSELKRSAWGAGLYLRGYLPSVLRAFDPYVELGLGYVHDQQSYQRGVATSIGSLAGDWSLDHHGVAVPTAIGLDYRVLPMLAVGPSFRYARVFGAGGCLKESVDTPLGPVSNSSCTDASESQRVTRADSYGVWSLGLDVRLTL